MPRDVVIAGIGAQTAIGRTPAAAAAAVRAGHANFAAHPSLLDSQGEPVIVARAPWLPEDLAGAGRLLALAIPAARQALEGSSRARRARVSIVLGLPSPRPGAPEDAAVEVLEGLVGALREDFYGRGLHVEGTRYLPSGHAAGSMAIESGWQQIRAGEVDLCLAGGVDSYLSPKTLEWLEATLQLHSLENSWGFVPGEGAGFCLLVRPDHGGGRPPIPPGSADRAEGGALGAVVSAATAQETKLIKTRTVCTGEGLTAAFRAALRGLPAGALIDRVYCDLNGEPYRADEYGFAAVRARRQLRDPGAFTTPADCWGDVGAASGPLFVGLAIEAGRRGYSRGEYSLLSASSETGERAASVVEVQITPRES